MELKLQSPRYGEKIVYIDDEDFELISKYHWNIAFVRGKWYAVAHNYIDIGKWNQIKMHRLVMGVLTTPKIHIDHKDQNGLNNMKDNLREATISQNSSNVGITKRNSSGYKGVYLFKPTSKLAGRYGVYLSSKREKIFGGYFDNVIDAAKKYNELAIKHHGEFASLNNIP